MVKTIILYRIIIILLASSLLDFIFGDPRILPHPIIYIGKLISKLEKVLNIKLDNKSSIIRGGILWVITVFTAFIVPATLLIGLYNLNFYAGLLLEVFWCFQILAGRTLALEAKKVKQIIETGTIDDARKALSMIVGRDTSSLNREEITKAVIETVSENTTDGVVSPLIAIAIGGAPLGFLYKGINTLDSMVGYKNEKYLYFGRVSAIIDDVANYIPARITGISMVIASVFQKNMSTLNAVKILVRDRKKHASPNGGWTEATTAGALGIQLGGDASYFGVIHKKASLGDQIRKPVMKDIDRTCVLMWTASGIILIALVGIRAILAYNGVSLFSLY